MLIPLAAAILGTTAMPDRANDWRNGPIVYQVFVDRFAPTFDLKRKQALYPAPDMLREWSQTPKGTKYDPKIKTYPHVREFWGGDLPSLRSKLDYIRDLGADVLYLQPIFRSPSNHKYDTEDYFQVDPQYGNQVELRGLIREVHSDGMKLMLDGVFNHIGATSPIFQEAYANPESKRRNWFYFGKEYKDGYRGWAGVASLPGLRLEEPEVRKYLWGADDSVVQKYLKDGIDGWRLDVGFEIGPEFLEDLTQHAHRAKPGSAVVGEISGYPSNWFPSVDGTFNFFALTVAEGMVKGTITGGQAGRIYDQMVQDAGIENLLKCWLLTDNHDTPRLATIVPDAKLRRIVQALQFTLPGAPVIYYGSELGMTGSGDPESRAPMRWDLANSKNLDLSWILGLIEIRKKTPSLRYGDFVALDSQKLLCFVRTNGVLKETALVAVNPTSETVRETVPTRIGRLMSWGDMEDQLTGQHIGSFTGLVSLEMKPYSVMILTPAVAARGGYSPYNRVK